jgi:hypothetical protein
MGSDDSDHSMDRRGNSRSRSDKDKRKHRKKSRSPNKAPKQSKRDQEPGKGSDDNNVSMSDMASMFKAMQFGLDTHCSTMQTQNATMLGHIKDIKGDVGTLNHTVQGHSQLHKSYDQKFADLNVNMAKLIDSSKRDSELVQKSMEETRTTIRTASVPPLPQPRAASTTAASSKFDRAPNPCVLVFNLHDNPTFAKVDLAKAIKVVMDTKGLDCEFEIVGKLTARKFPVTFKGPVAESMVEMLLLARKKPDGSWADHMCDIPGAPPAKLYMQPDKSPMCERVETVTRKFAAYLKNKHTSHKFGERREDGIISVDGTRLAFISAAPEKVSIKWNKMGFEGNELDKDELATHFEKAFNVEWSS